MKRVENGPVTGLPSHLVCGECGSRVRAQWEIYGHNWEPAGGIGFGQCKCGVTVYGIVARDRDFADLAESCLKDAELGALAAHPRPQ